MKVSIAGREPREETRGTADFWVFESVKRNGKGGIALVSRGAARCIDP